MKKISTINRNASYNELKDDGTLSKRRQQVYDAIKGLKHATSPEIGELLGLPINQITGRVKELMELGEISVFGSKLNPKTRKYNTIYSLAYEPTLFDNPKDVAKDNKAKKILKLIERFNLYPESADSWKIAQIKKIL
jgi:DNA-binding Lrp family transcriptional regulator